MNKEQLTLFEGQEIKIKTNKGITLINLANTAKVLGLTTFGVNGNEKIRWKTKGVSEKLNKILECTDVHQEQYIKEIKYILEEIENADDRTQIYMSRYLTSMLAMECHNNKAMEYKSWLAKLDESYSNGSLIQGNNPYMQLGDIAQQMQLMSNVMNNIGQAFNGMQQYVQDSIQSKDTQIEQAMNLIGFRNVNTKRMINEIKSKLSNVLNRKITANDKNFQYIKQAIFKNFSTIKWEDIPVMKYNEVYAFVDELIEDKFGKAC